MGSQKTRQSQPYLAFMRDPVLAGNDGKRNGVVIYDINSSASWEDLGPAVKLLKIEDMEFRSYEFSIARTIYKGENTLAIVPTGKGKTILELLAAAKAISDGKRAIFVAATKPLAQQHYNEAISRFRDTEGIDMLVGTVDRKKRDDICKNSKLIIGTPEKVVNEILSGRIKLEDFGVGIIDETQRTRGEYAYSKLADLLNEKHIQIVSLTGSLSSQKSMAGAIISRLNIENVEVRDWKDKDIAPYMRKVDVKRIYVEKSPEMLEIDKAFKKLIKTNIDAMMKAGLLEDSSFNFGALADQQPEVAIDFEKMSRRKFLALQKDVDSLGDEVSAMISKANEDRSMGRMADSNLQEDIRTKIKGMKSFTKLKYIFHAYDTFQTQGFAPTLDYIEKLDSNYRNRKNKQYRSKGLAELLYGREDEQYGVHMREGTMHEVFDPIAKAVSLGQEHPKVEALMNIVRENPKEKIMIFANYRATVDMIVGKLKKEGFDARPFIGQRGGMTQKMQRATMDDFSDSKFNIIVSTSIGEEGIDFKGEGPSHVIGYDTPPSGIRVRQRGGRTGRKLPGKMTILITRGTPDEAYDRIASLRERGIDRVNESLRRGELRSMMRQGAAESKKPPVRQDNSGQIPTLTGTQLSLIGIRQHIDVG